MENGKILTIPTPGENYNVKQNFLVSLPLKNMLRGLYFSLRDDPWPFLV